MEILITIAIFLVVYSIQYLPIYLSYLFVSCKQVTQAKMHKVSFMVAGISIGCALITRLLNCTSVAFPVTSRNGVPDGTEHAPEKQQTGMGILRHLYRHLRAADCARRLHPITNKTFRMLMTEE